MQMYSGPEVQNEFTKSETRLRFMKCFFFFKRCKMWICFKFC